MQICQFTSKRPLAIARTNNRTAQIWNSWISRQTIYHATLRDAGLTITGHITACNSSSLCDLSNSWSRYAWQRDGYRRSKTNLFTICSTFTICCVCAHIISRTLLQTCDSTSKRTCTTSSGYLTMRSRWIRNCSDTYTTLRHTGSAIASHITACNSCRFGNLSYGWSSHTWQQNLFTGGKTNLFTISSTFLVSGVSTHIVSGGFFQISQVASKRTFTIATANLIIRYSWVLTGTKHYTALCDTRTTIIRHITTDSSRGVRNIGCLSSCYGCYSFGSCCQTNLLTIRSAFSINCIRTSIISYTVLQIS